MSFDTNWDINKYKYHYELPHNWELKKKFMLFHKNKFPEDRLVCLAQIFCNVHELGCRYGDDIMELVDELTKGLFDRNEKFDSKSFALASDAVEERVKAFTGQNKSSNQPQRRNLLEPIGFVKSSGGETSEVVDLTESPPVGRKRPSDNSSNGNYSKAPKYEEQQHQQEGGGGGGSAGKVFSWESRRAAAQVSEVVESGPFGKVVVFRSAAQVDGPVGIIERAASAAHMRTSFDYTQTNDGNHFCKFCLDGLYVSHGEGPSIKVAKEAACKLALDRLQETSYTIEVKASYVGGDVVERNESEARPGPQQKGASVDVPLAESNIGSKLLKMMGWTGGGLGKDGDGIQEPIKPYDQNIRRGGLGITNFSDFRRKVSRIIQDYAHSDDKNDLVFSPDFSKDERKVIHELVRRFNLKSRSYGKEEEKRHIVVFRKISPLEIVQDLLACGGETDKYKLIPPNPKVK